MFFEAEFLPMVERIRNKVATVKNWVLIGETTLKDSSWIHLYDSLIAKGENKKKETHC